MTARALGWGRLVKDGLFVAERFRRGVTLGAKNGAVLAHKLERRLPIVTEDRGRPLDAGVTGTTIAIGAELSGMDVRVTAVATRGRCVEL